MSELLKERIVQRIDTLTDDRLGEVLDFVELLVDQQASANAADRPELQSGPDADPILEFIGGVEHGSLAQKIDDEIYGS